MIGSSIIRRGLGVPCVTNSKGADTSYTREGVRMSSAQQQRITEDEQRKYWEIFTALNPQNGFLNGFQAKSVLENSQLDNTQLEAIWDLADVDNGLFIFGRTERRWQPGFRGVLCSHETHFRRHQWGMFRKCSAVNTKVYPSVPKTLPDFLVPSSKAHLVAANQALAGGLKLERPVYEDEDDTPVCLVEVRIDLQGLSNDFDWYISPADNRNYEHIYAANHNRHGQISFNSLADFYETIEVPDTDIRRAWNLINPKQSEFIGKDATMYFLHILHHRHRGVRIPRNIPASLRATLNQGEIDYDVSRAKIGRGREEDVPVRRPRDRDDWRTTASSRKDDFAAGYLSRLGVGEGSSKYNSTGMERWRHAELINRDRFLLSQGHRLGKGAITEGIGHIE